MSEVMLHNKLNDCWIVLNDEVYDVTSFIAAHPGGVQRILEVAGSDATEKFYQIHSEDVLNKMKEKLVYVGKLKGKFSKIVTEEELRIQDQRLKMPPLSMIFNSTDFESVAKQVLPKSTFIYYATGASDEYTVRENHYAYSRIFFKPKALQGSDYNVDTSTTFLGSRVDLPFYITAFAGAKWADPLGEFNLQSAAYDSNVMQMVPKQVSFGFDTFFDAVPDDQNHWCQFHFDTREEIDTVSSWIKKYEAMPSIKGIFFNVDLPDIGNREKDSRQRAVDSKGSEELNAVVNNSREEGYAKFTWRDIENIVSSTRLPVALKGVQRGEDVVIAAEKGVKAVVLSNHGGRQLDFSRPPLEVLAEAKQMLKEKGLEDKIEIYVDGGVRRGSDILKALCLGAKGVGLGRPFLYAMSGYGEEGVAHLISLLKKEIQNNMRLLGVDKIEDLDDSFIDYKNLNLKNPRINDVLYDEAYCSLSAPEFKK